MSVMLTTLVSFNGSDGGFPDGGLIADAAGDLFGTTTGGGGNGDGTVFEIVKTADGYASTPTTLVTFNGSNGASPFGGLIVDAAGDLLGTTAGGGANNDSTVFEIAKTASGYASTPTVLESYGGGGEGLFAGLVADAAGDLFSTTSNGGTYGHGAVFEIAKTADGYASTPTTIASFFLQEWGPLNDAPLIADAAGDLFGTTQGSGYNGTAFEIAKTAGGYASTPIKLADLGSQPSALIADAAGDLFGTTQGPEDSGDYGTVFEIAKTATGYASMPTILANFNYGDGAVPTAGPLIADVAGDLFGITTQGGANGDGTVFEIAKTASGYASTPITLLSLSSNNDAFQISGLIADANGDLFGTTSDGYGTVFEITGAPFAVTTIWPTISGTHGSTTTSEATVTPFSGVTIADVNDGGIDIDTLTITQSGAGVLSGAGLVATATAGVYTIIGTAATITTELDALSFKPVNGSLGTASTASFTLIDSSSASADSVSPSDSATTVADIDPSSVVISGTAQAGQTLTATSNAHNPVSYQWLALVGGNWVAIGGASGTGSTFFLTPDDAGYQIEVRVIFASRPAYTNGIVLTSAPTNSVRNANGSQSVYGADNGSTIGDGQYQYVFGTATNTAVNNGGEQNIYANGIAIGATINVGGTQLDWGTANNTVIAGGIEYVYATATATTIDAGTQAVAGVATGTTINSGGEQDLYSSASASGTTIAGGAQYVYGASVDRTTIDNGGLQYLHGTATNTLINSGGEQNVYSDGTATGTTVNSGGQQVDWGSDNSATINGGTQFVAGIASGAVVNSGTQYIESGGVANGTTIAGGTEHVWSGGTAVGVTFGGSSGALVLDQGSGLTGSVSGFQAGDTIDLSFMSFGGAGTTLGYQANASGPTGGTLTVSDGTNVATLALLGQYSASSFALAADSSGGTMISVPNAQQTLLASAH